MFKADSKNNQSCCAVFRAQTRGELPVFLLRQKAEGYTLVEVMIAVTLTLILMYALAAIFGRVTSMMTQTQDILSMTNNLRTAKDRLREDLENLTVPTLKAPTSQYGFFSYSEGLGNAFLCLFDGNNGNWIPENSRTSTTYGNFDRRTPTPDNTVGDTDDILSFTVRAPAGKWFRGRCFKRPEEVSYDALIDDNIEMIESEYAEVIWFLRGTTLYRRVLLIVPDEFLEKRLKSLNEYISHRYSNLYVNELCPSSGYGFYRFFDISVHYDPNAQRDWEDVNGNSHGRVVANTLPDLANRKNRFGYWASPVIPPQNSNFTPDFGLHGVYGSWYWLRMPTLQESALWTGEPDSSFSFFCAGFPFGRAPFDFPFDFDPNEQSQNVLPLWTGEYLQLGLKYFGPDPPDKVYTSASLPGSYFIDQWQVPNPWVQQQTFSGQLDLTKINDEVKTFNTDVLLTNVLCFDVKVWNEKSSSFVDLGEDTDGVGFDPSDFRSDGNYGPSAFPGLTTLFDPSTHQEHVINRFYRPIMPAVFDTWTEDYEKEFLMQSWPLNDVPTGIFGASSRPGFTVGDIPLDGKVTSSDLPDYPPPYEAEVKVIQVELRAFDPVSRTIKNATVEIKIP